LCLAVCGALDSATIKRKSGETVEGTIQGVIVEKGVSQKKNKYFVFYILANGKDVDVIDKGGMHTVQDISRLLLAGEYKQKQRPPDDLDVLTSLVTRNPFAAPNWGDMGWRLKPLPGDDRLVLTCEGNFLGFAVPLANGGSLTSFYLGNPVKADSADAKQIPRELSKDQKDRDLVRTSDALLGEFRMKAGVGTIVPAIEVGATAEVVTIPVSEIVEFKRTEDAAPEKK
jgi:hypothetical protein